MGAISCINPSEGLTQTDRKNFRIAAMAAGIDRCQVKSIGNVRDDYPGLATVASPEARVAYIQSQIQQGNMPRSIDIRELQPTLDAGVAAAADFWLTAALAAVAGAVSCFGAVPAPANPANRIVVFYKVAVLTVGFPVSRLIIRSGGALGNILGVYDLEQIESALVPEGYLSEPAVIDPSITYAVQVVCRVATGVAARVALGTFVFEPAGQTIA